MKNLHSELLFWIGEREVTVDALHEHIHEQLGGRYEIGDAELVVNEMIVYSNEVIANSEYYELH